MIPKLKTPKGKKTHIDKDMRGVCHTYASRWLRFEDPEGEEDNDPTCRKCLKKGYQLELNLEVS